ncbi:MAG: DUF3267 domain-containing protein [Dehalogenimonas sp.]
MRLIKRLPEVNQKLHKELINNGWITLREPGSLMGAIVMSLPLMIINLFVAIVVIGIYSTTSYEEFGFTSGSFSINIDFGMIIALITLVVIHELLHLISIPNFSRSSKTFVGVTLYGGFVVTEEKIARSRYILITVAPFLTASVILPLILGILGLLTPIIKLLVLLNAMASSVDILNLLLVLKQVPTNTVLVNNGPKTYWKKCEQE